MKRKKDETKTEISENEFVETITETEPSNQSIDNRNAENDAESTFAESQAKTESPATTDEIDVDALLNEYVPKKKRGRKPKEEEKSPLLIPGELLIHVTDNIAVGLIGYADTLFTKNPIDVQLLALREEQKQKLVPAANEAIRAMNLQGNPIAVFFAMMGSMYISNYMIIRTLMKQSEKQSE